MGGLEQVIEHILNLDPSLVNITDQAGYIPPCITQLNMDAKMQ